MAFLRQSPAAARGSRAVSLSLSAFILLAPDLAAASPARSAKGGPGLFAEKQSKKPPGRAAPPPALSKKKCALSGEEVLLEESSQMDFYIKFSAFNAENIEKVAAAILDSGKTGHCPKSCVQENHYKSYVTVRHAAALKGSCPPEQAKEAYSFKKNVCCQKQKRKRLNRRRREKSRKKKGGGQKSQTSPYAGNRRANE